MFSKTVWKIERIFVNIPSTFFHFLLCKYKWHNRATKTKVSWCIRHRTSYPRYIVFRLGLKKCNTGFSMHTFLAVWLTSNTFWEDISLSLRPTRAYLQYIPRNVHAVFALLCFVVVIHWLIFPYQSGLLHWHCGNLTIAPVPAKQPWWIWINTSCEFIMNDCITTTKQSTTKPCAYFLGYTVVETSCHDVPLP